MAEIIYNYFDEHGEQQASIWLFLPEWVKDNFRKMGKGPK